ncbi:uncharacterized protein PG986_013836 [Apiospora aurea]|uniref:Tyrosinase copper-binding domain-containing protein n=1 Tax=Apiospora aurea TaxID=335848 RepID=A0ABR1PX03_9PEZI
MKFLSMLMAAGAVAPAIALPAVQPRETTCTHPAKRVEWRQLSAADQQSYIKAVLCLKTKPSKMGLNTSLYDDFPNVHFNYNIYIHGSAPFLPWHRYFTHVYFNALRECGYEGPGTYWDWTQDTAGLRHSAIMSPTAAGFGGDGNPDKTELSPDGESRLHCVTDGPFAGLRPEYLGITPKDMVGGGHCMFRDLPEVSEPQAFATMAGTFGPEGVAQVQASADFAIDHLWWQWQQKNASRLEDYNGKASHLHEAEAREVSLDDVVPMNGLAKDITVREIMDTVHGELCYTY